MPGVIKLRPTGTGTWGENSLDLVRKGSPFVLYELQALEIPKARMGGRDAAPGVSGGLELKTLLHSSTALRMRHLISCYTIPATFPR